MNPTLSTLPCACVLENGFYCSLAKIFEERQHKNTVEGPRPGDRTQNLCTAQTILSTEPPCCTKAGRNIQVNESKCLENENVAFPTAFTLWHQIFSILIENIPQAQEEIPHVFSVSLELHTIIDDRDRSEDTAISFLIATTWHGRTKWNLRRSSMSSSSSWFDFQTLWTCEQTFPLFVCLVIFRVENVALCQCGSKPTGAPGSKDPEHDELRQLDPP